MSRLSSTINKHRKDNYSLDIKGVYKPSIIQTPFSKKKQGDEKFFMRLKTQFTHNVSMQSSDKQIGIQPKRRFSLTKTFKMNHSVGIQSHLSKQKFKRVTQLFSEEKYQQCLSLLRQLITKEQNMHLKMKLFWINSKCLIKIGKTKDAQHILTKILNQQPNNYEAIMERAKVRSLLGAKQLAIRDLKHAIHVNPLKQQGYRQLCSLFIQQGEQRQAYATVNLAIEKGVQSVQLLLYIVQLLLTYPNITVSSEQKATFLVEKLRTQLGQQSKDSADLLYLQARLLQTERKWSQACIYYEQCLKFNNSKFSVTKSTERLILIKIEQRDYYSAYHTVSRCKILNIEYPYIFPYSLFLEGVILIMKKKYLQGMKLFDIFIQMINGQQVHHRAQLLLQNYLKQSSFLGLNKSDIPLNFKLHHRFKVVILPLLYKFNAYASFKLGKHQKCISYYDKLSSWGLDECSSYNLLLAEGIVAVEKKKNFQLGMQKFEQARYVYPCKVEPSIYIAMTVVYRDLCLSDTADYGKGQTQSLTSAVVHAIQQLNQAYETVNNSSSNLLFHRSILNMYLQNWSAAQSDINLCIQKAEENQPKYFYLRGLSFAVEKDMKRAINQYSISLSLSSQYLQSLLERAKCYFLLGQTQIGFTDLKQYMQKNPEDHSVHKWIGDLLYQGKSYSDALRAYEEIEDSLIFEVQVMKCKCLFRISDLHKVNDCLTKMGKFEECDDTKIQVDMLALSLLKSLTKSNQNSKQLALKIKKLNSFLQQNVVGYLFELIDCMNLLGIATFQATRYQQAYQSFLLVLQLYSTIAQKNKSQLKSDSLQQSLSLKNQDIYLNIVFSLLGLKDYESAVRIMSEELLISIKDSSLIKKIAAIIQNYELGDKNLEIYSLQTSNKKNEKIKFKHIDLKIKQFKIKCNPSFSLFHNSADDLYLTSVAQKLVKNLKPSYIDNMPEGPWIKRNEHGVIFTDQVIEDESSSTFLSSMRAKQSSEVSQENTQRVSHSQSVELQKRQNFKRKMKLDQQIEQKLNNIIKKAQQTD